jgi:hypothetical protein
MKNVKFPQKLFESKETHKTTLNYMFRSMRGEINHEQNDKGTIWVLHKNTKS